MLRINIASGAFGCRLAASIIVFVAALFVSAQPRSALVETAFAQDTAQEDEQEDPGGLWNDLQKFLCDVAPWCTVAETSDANPDGGGNTLEEEIPDAVPDDLQTEVEAHWYDGLVDVGKKVADSITGFFGSLFGGDAGESAGAAIDPAESDDPASPEPEDPVDVKKESDTDRIIMDEKTNVETDPVDENGNEMTRYTTPDGKQVAVYYDAETGEIIHIFETFPDGTTTETTHTDNSVITETTRPDGSSETVIIEGSGSTTQPITEAAGCQSLNDCAFNQTCLATTGLCVDVCPEGGQIVVGKSSSPLSYCQQCAAAKTQRPSASDLLENFWRQTSVTDRATESGRLSALEQDVFQAETAFRRSACGPDEIQASGLHARNLRSYCIPDCDPFDPSRVDGRADIPSVETLPPEDVVREFNAR